MPPKGRHHMGTSFAIEETVDGDGMLSVSLVGDLDLAATDPLTACLEQLLDEGGAVRLDLARLKFIDSPGIRALAGSVEAGRRGGGELFEVKPTVDDRLRRRLERAGVGSILWPRR